MTNRVGIENTHTDRWLSLHVGGSGTHVPEECPICTRTVALAQLQEERDSLTRQLLAARIDADHQRRDAITAQDAVRSLTRQLETSRFCEALVADLYARVLAERDAVQAVLAAGRAALGAGP